MLLLWAVLVILIAVNGQMAQAAECFKNDGREGRCMDIDNCNVSLKAFDECKLIPDKCDKGVYSPQVCCPVWPVIMKRPIEYSCETFGSNRRLIGQAVNNHTRFPHAAALGYLEPNKTLNCYSYKCGGTLIHWRYVLTAAHCITSTGPKVVLMGVSDLRKDELPRYAQRIEVKSVLPHEGYPQDTYKDIALVHLKESIVETPYVSPACLLTADIIRNGEVTTIGWGKGEQPGLLQEAKLSVVKCAKKTERNHVICARSKIYAACEGDSGGPLLVYHNNMQYVVGVYSYGPTFCKKNALGRFLAVTPFLDWIEKIVWPAQHCVYKKHLEQ